MEYLNNKFRKIFQQIQIVTNIILSEICVHVRFRTGYLNKRGCSRKTNIKKEAISKCHFFKTAPV
jgi:hypothetical protein